MTPHPQQEYIITGEQIHRWEDDLTTIDCEFQTRNNPEPTMISRSLITTIRSRPAHAAPACPHWGIEHSDGIEWVCDKTALSLDAATIRNESRLDELTNLQDFREKEMNTVPFDPWVFINRENKRISNLIESLRTPSPQEQP